MAALTSSLFKVVVIGDSGVGKTSVLSRYISGKHEFKYKATIGCDLMNKNVSVDGVEATLQIWDTAGQEKFQSLARPFYRGSDAAVLVFDVTSSASLSGLEFWRNEFLQGAFVADPSAFPMVVFGNKVDEDDSLWEVSKAEAQAWADKYGLPLFYTSAKDDVGLEDGFGAVASACMKTEREDVMDDGVVQVQKLQPQEKSGCAC